MTHLLDTDTCIGVLRQRPGMRERLRSHAPDECRISAITAYELFSGIGNARNPAQEREKIEQFLLVVKELPFDRDTAEMAAKIRVDLEKIGKVIGPYDLLIAGHALASNLILVTGNVGEFQRVKDLSLETWS